MVHPITSNKLANIIRMMYMTLIVADNNAQHQDNRIYNSCPLHIYEDIRKMTVARFFIQTNTKMEDVIFYMFKNVLII